MWKILFNSLSNCKEIITLKSYLKQDNVAPHPTELYLISIRFRFPLLRLLLFLIDLKSVILSHSREKTLT